jgi:hypothetical protein
LKTISVNIFTSISMVRVDRMSSQKKNPNKYPFVAKELNTISIKKKHMIMSCSTSKVKSDYGPKHKTLMSSANNTKIVMAVTQT